jgi:uncharacterized protein (TIGR03000 family)
MQKTLNFFTLALLSGGAFLCTDVAQAQYGRFRPPPIRPPIDRPNHMPGWDWWRIYPWSPYNYGRNPYNPIRPPYYPYPPIYAPTVATTYVGPNYYGASAAGTQEPIPHPSGGKPVPPPDAAGIQLLLPERFADVWFNGTKTSSIGVKRYYVTPELEEKAHEYDVKVSWQQGGRTQTEERTITVRPGQTTVVDFTAKQEARNAAPPSQGGPPAETR